MMLDFDLFKNDADRLEEDNNNDDEDSSNYTTIRLVPEDKTLLNSIFVAMNECQALYPNSMSDDEDDDDEEEQAGEEEEEGVYNEEYNDDEEGNQAEEFVDVEIDNRGGGIIEDQPIMDVQLSERGQQILRRLNINYQNGTS
jgi:hypothetical protein